MTIFLASMSLPAIFTIAAMYITFRNLPKPIEHNQTEGEDPP